MSLTRVGNPMLIGGPTTPIVNKSGTYSLTDNDRILRATTGSAWSLTIQAASPANQDTIFRIQKVSSDFNLLTLTGGLSTTLVTIGEYIDIANDGTTWYIVGRGGISGVLVSTTVVGIISAGASNPVKGTVSEKAAWYRNGGKLECFYSLRQTGAGSRGTAATAYFWDAVPSGSGLTVDTTNLKTGFSNFDSEAGQCGVGAGDNHAIYADDTAGKTGIQFMRDGANCLGQEFGLDNATMTYSGHWELPITQFVV